MFVDDLITRYAPKNETFTVTLFDGEELKFKYVFDYTDIKKLQTGAADFATRMVEKKIPLTGDMKEYWTDNIEVLTTAYVMAGTIQEPKISELEFLKLAKKAGVMFQYIANQYNYNETKAIVQNELAEVEAQKKD